jgi:hypothetical protein
MTVNEHASVPPLVFLSHSSSDRDFVEQLRGRIEAAGTKCWIASRDLRTGEEMYAGQIIAAIEACPFFLVVVSGSALDSPHVLREVEKAVSHRSRILVVRRQPVDLRGDWEYFLRSVQWIDAVDRPDDAVTVNLLSALKGPSMAGALQWVRRSKSALLGLAVLTLVLAVSIFLRLQPPVAEPAIVAVLTLAAIFVSTLASSLFWPWVRSSRTLSRSLGMAFAALALYAVLRACSSTTPLRQDLRAHLGPDPRRS